MWALIKIYCLWALLSSNIFIGTVQEIRAKKTIDKLSLIAGKAHVIRDGIKQEIAIHDIVMDDITSWSRQPSLLRCRCH